MTTRIRLRDYQAVAVQAVREAFRANQWPVLFVMPTGSGKTVTFSHITDSAASLGRRVLIIVHRKELLLQASASLTLLGVEHGLISPEFTPSHDVVQVASVDTLVQRLKKRSYKFDLVIFDEAHHCVETNKWGRCYEQLGRPAMLGVTATPVRTDGKGLGEHAGGLFKSLILGPSVSELVAQRMLIAPTVYTSLIVPDLQGIKKTRDGEYDRVELAARVDKPRITGDAVDHYTKICPGARAIVFCSGIEHAKHVRDEFNAAGYRFELLVGAPEMSDAERSAVNKRLRRGEINGACTVDLVSEGYDLPDLECCVMLRPTASEALFLQQIGRVMRPSDGKVRCWLLDHVGNVGGWLGNEFVRKHGLPTEDREWTLDGRRKRSSKKKPDEPVIAIRQCPSCFLVHEPAPACPGCGHEYPAGARAPAEQVEGELLQVTAEMAERMKAARQREVQRTKTLEQLQEIAKQRGYSEKWATHIYAAKRRAHERHRSRFEPPLAAYMDR